MRAFLFIQSLVSYRHITFFQTYLVVGISETARHSSWLLNLITLLCKSISPSKTRKTPLQSKMGKSILWRSCEPWVFIQPEEAGPAQRRLSRQRKFFSTGVPFFYGSYFILPGILGLFRRKIIWIIWKTTKFGGQKFGYKFLQMQSDWHLLSWNYT